MKPDEHPLPMYQVDAFTGKLFGGNPAAVVPLTEWLPEGTMQLIAAENNLAETAFFVPIGDSFHLRWFTPAVEVDLCGHATLASAWVLFERLKQEGERIHFDTLSGRLTVARDGDLLWMDFPARPAIQTEAATVVEAVGGSPQEVLKARDHMLVYGSADEVLKLGPDMLKLAGSGAWAAIATAPGKDCDFVSRFFAPAAGIPEDPATGSSHCTLTPYWAKRLGKSRLSARQVSPRGGELICELAGDRVRIGGRAVLYLEGLIYLR